MSEIVHVFFEHPYMKFTIAFVVCVLLAFIDRIQAFKTKTMFYVLSVVVALMILSNIYNDYGFLLLMICLLVMTYSGLKSEA